MQFYRQLGQLATTVSGFLCEGLIYGQPALLIATPPSLDAILTAMRSRFIDVASAELAGDLLLVDPHETLASLLDGGRPDRDRAEARLGALIDRLAQKRPHATVRVFGEMVNVLWQKGQLDAALELEALWNGLARRHRFALLCGYALGDAGVAIESFQTICDEHTHVIQSDGGLLMPGRCGELPS